MGETVVFDVETQRAIQAVGGAAHLDQLRVSVAVAYEVQAGRFHHFEEPEVPELISLLRRASLVVGYNIRHFDLSVLAPYSEHPLDSLPTCDLMVDLQRRLGHRVALDNVAQQTLGLGKGASGIQALRWWREGQIALIRDYCQQDVDLTRRVWEYGKAHGHVWVWSKTVKKRLPVPVSW